MASITIFVCFSIILIQSVSSQCLGREPIGLGQYPGWGPYDAIGPYDGYNAYPGFIGLSPGNLAASCGGALAISSVSPIIPTGLTITSENAIEGSVAVVGQLPFLGAVATDGAFSSAGLGAVVYGCGDGAIGIVSEGPVAAPVGYGGAVPVGYGSWNAGYKPYGCAY